MKTEIIQKIHDAIKEHPKGKIQGLSFEEGIQTALESCLFVIEEISNQSDKLKEKYEEQFRIQEKRIRLLEFQLSESNKEIGGLYNEPCDVCKSYPIKSNKQNIKQEEYCVCDKGWAMELIGKRCNDCDKEIKEPF